MNVIVSLASHYARFPTLHICLQSIFNQSFSPHKIILNVAEKDKDQIPQTVYAYCEKGLEIQYVSPDLYPHNKYFFTMKQYPKDIIITLDDDVIYPSNLLKKLMLSYSKFPKAVSAGRAHQICFDKKKNILPYNLWARESTLYNTPSFELFATGVGGVLYPPECMSENLFNIDAIQKLCLYADDIWLKCMQLLKKTPVVLIEQTQQHPTIIPETLNDGLYKINKLQDRNDFYLNNVLETYNITYERINYYE